MSQSQIRKLALILAPFLLVLIVLISAIPLARGSARSAEAAPRREQAAPRSQVARVTETPASTGTPTPTGTPTLGVTVTATPTMCAMTTPEPLWVEPVVSPTDLLSQTLTVRIGNGEAVTVTAESGVFSGTGSFDAYGNPARVTIDLWEGTTHHLEVQAKVRRMDQGGCIYGGYTLYTRLDRFGKRLVIEQTDVAITPTRTATPGDTADSTRRLYLPQILGNH